jgi:hypothetical protein
MQKITCAMTLLVAAMAPTACGSVETEDPGGGGDVTGTAKTLYKPSSGDVLLADPSHWATIEALVDHDGALESFPGTIDAEDNILIPHVPFGDYYLTLTALPDLPVVPPRKDFIWTDARTLDLDLVFSFRPDRVINKEPTFFTVQASLGVPWQAKPADDTGNLALTDDLQFVSRDAELSARYQATDDDAAGDNPPTDGASEVAGWKIDQRSSLLSGGGFTLVDGNQGDDFTILHDVATQVGKPTSDGNPWNGYVYTATPESLTPPPFTMTAGGTTALSGAFTATPTKTFDLDFKGAAFNALLQGIPISSARFALAVNLRLSEPTNENYPLASLLQMSVSSGRIYTNPSVDCQVSVGCDAAKCPKGCDAGTLVPLGDHTHAYTYANPFSFGREQVEAHLYFGTNLTMMLPPDTNFKTLRGEFTIQAPASELSGKPLQPTLGLPQNIRVAGESTPYDQVTVAVGETPMITWSAPSLGKPDGYRVDVIDLTDWHINKSSKVVEYNVGSLFLTTPSVRLPEGLLRAGRFYYVRVSAQTRDDHDVAALPKHSIHATSSTMFTGVITP